MVPIVVTDTAQADQRAGKSLEWREAKLVLVHAPGSTELHYRSLWGHAAGCCRRGRTRAVQQLVSEVIVLLHSVMRQDS